MSTIYSPWGLLSIIYLLRLGIVYKTIQQQMTEEITFVLYIPESESCSDVLLKKKKNTY